MHFKENSVLRWVFTLQLGEAKIMVLKALSREKQRDLKLLLKRINGTDASPEEKHRLRELWMEVRDDIIKLENMENGESASRG
jgi:hypothetical protein